jgi:putative phage-type endonuclease
MIHPSVQKLIDKKYADQRTSEWYSLRNKMLTASDVATALDLNPYETAEDLMYKKCGHRKFTGNAATEHGNKYEPDARDLYCSKTGEVVHEIGLEPHPVYSWLGGSPDGVTESGKLIEIKCPVSRKITSIVPSYYIPQVQILMEILDLEECDFIQYKPDGPEYIVTNIKRDREWFDSVKPRLETFWNRVLERRTQPLCEIE